MDDRKASARAPACAIIYSTLTRRRPGNAAYKYALGLALVAAYILIYVNSDIGIIGTESNDANLMYGGVLAVGGIGAIMARFQPDGMARALFATAIAQVLVAVIALLGGLGSEGPIWPMDILILTGFFVALWLASAQLFRHATRGKHLVGAGQEAST